NAPKCPWHNLQRDGHMQTQVHAGRVNYEPNSLMPKAPREDPRSGFRGLARAQTGETQRVRAESFGDHYTQAKLVYVSQTRPEQAHIAAALVFELSKVETPAVRERVVSHLVHVDERLANRVAAGLRLDRTVEAAQTKMPARRDVKPSPALSIIGKAPETLK